MSSLNRLRLRNLRPNRAQHTYPHLISSCFFFFFNDPPPPELYPLSLHDALPISIRGRRRRQPEVLLRRLLHPLRILAAAFLQRLATHLLGEPQRLVPRGVQAARGSALAVSFP